MLEQPDSTAPPRNAHLHFRWVRSLFGAERRIALMNEVSFLLKGNPKGGFAARAPAH